MQSYKAISAIYPAVQNILHGKKTVEIRSWQPPMMPLLDLVLVENFEYLKLNDIDPNGTALAIVDIITISEWTYEDYLQQSEATTLNKKWKPGYFMWHIDNIRKIAECPKVIAKAGIYDILI